MTLVHDGLVKMINNSNIRQEYILSYIISKLGRKCSVMNDRPPKYTCKALKAELESNNVSTTILVRTPHNM